MTPWLPSRGTWAISGDTDDDNSVSSGGLSPDLGDVWKNGCPEQPRMGM